MIRICGDFNEKDEKGRVVLRYADDVKNEDVVLREGMPVTVWEDETEVDGVLEFEDGFWRARLDEATLRHTR